MGWEENLYTATFLTKIGDDYFIVDCWHHQIIYSDDLAAPIKNWKTLDADIAGPHSIVSDGQLLVADDTGRHRLFVYRKSGDGYERCQIIDSAGVRPHRVLYCPERKKFFAIGSGDQRVMTLRNRDGVLETVSEHVLDELQGQYVRSITLHMGRLFAVGNTTIVELKIDGDTMAAVGIFPLNITYYGANDLYFITTTSGILTGAPRVMTYFDSFDQLITAEGRSFLFDGTPYFISRVDDMLFIPEIIEHSRIIGFEGEPPDFSYETVIEDSGPPSEESLKRKAMLPI